MVLNAWESAIFITTGWRRKCKGFQQMYVISSFYCLLTSQLAVSSSPGQIRIPLGWDLIKA